MVEKVDAKQFMNYRIISFSVIFTAIVFVFTSVIVIATPATQGFFNIGEAGVYLAAILGGPIVGAIAGGLGSALADLFLGYAHYAPGTFVIKGLEGFIAGYLFRKIKELERNIRLIISLFFSVPFTAFVLYMARGGIGIYLDASVFGSKLVIKTTIPFVAIAIVILEIFVFIVVASYYESETIQIALASFLAGLEMVTGYFLYEAIVLGYGIVALMEIPVNIGQVIAGILIATPTIRTLREMGYRVES